MTRWAKVDLSILHLRPAYLHPWWPVIYHNWLASHFIILGYWSEVYIWFAYEKKNRCPLVLATSSVIHAWKFGTHTKKFDIVDVVYMKIQGPLLGSCIIAGALCNINLSPCFLFLYAGMATSRIWTFGALGQNILLLLLLYLFWIFGV